MWSCLLSRLGKICGNFEDFDNFCFVACFDKIKSSSVCFACGEKFREKDIIKIESGGTGYAANSGENLIAKKITPSAWV